ncbi:MAG: Co2+/Mg2+ efflux protein ApaG [Magnetococcales bacterium]|nr:Co2+/Mg2+ efflux protein ApaG [Magnetococcales bacterium]MBF0155827.1 Co2+/Mg2+ efflux protein ApaG [Magnetococcales bacterium]
MSDAPEPIHVHVTTRYLAERSDPDHGRYAFSYTVEIRNDGKRPFQLLRRHWLVESDNGHKQEVSGEGVIGQQPRLEPGHSFRYSSWTLLQTPTGHMRGRYYWVDDQGNGFWAPVPPFFFEVPGTRVLN